MLASAGGLIGSRLVTAERDPATKLARDFFSRVFGPRLLYFPLTVRKNSRGKSPCAG